MVLPAPGACNTPGCGTGIAPLLPAMIELTRLNGTHVVINALLIEQLESTPDTVVTLTTGRKIVVRETVEEVTTKAVQYLSSLRKVGVPLNIAQLGRVIR